LATGQKLFFTGVVCLCLFDQLIKGVVPMMEVKTFNSNQQLELPQHNCKNHLRIIEETHSVNSLHNIVIARKQKCKICSKVFESYDPRGLK
jgi:hypothetical protein